MQAKPAQIGRGVICNAEGEEPRRYYRAAGRFIVHRSFTHGWTVTLPSGAALGQRYWNRGCAEAAAAVMAPLVRDWNGLTLETVFGTQATAREAYDAARGANVY